MPVDPDGAVIPNVGWDPAKLSLIDATSWQNGVACSDGYIHWSQSFTTFEDSTIYCPPGYVAEEGYVSWTE